MKNTPILYLTSYMINVFYTKQNIRNNFNLVLQVFKILNTMYNFKTGTIKGIIVKYVAIIISKIRFPFIIFLVGVKYLFGRVLKFTVVHTRAPDLRRTSRS